MIDNSKDAEGTERSKALKDGLDALLINAPDPDEPLHKRDKANKGKRKDD